MTLILYYQPILTKGIPFEEKESQIREIAERYNTEGRVAIGWDGDHTQIVLFVADENSMIDCIREMGKLGVMYRGKA